MKAHLYSTVAKFDQRHIRLVVILVSLALFALGAGAPEITGGSGIR